jgi:hypothetical protein
MLEQLVGAAFGALKSRAAPSLTGLWLYLAAGLLFLLGGLYLSYAVFLALAEQLGPPWAGAITGALLMLFATLALLVALLLNRPPPKPAAATPAVEGLDSELTDLVLRAADYIGHKFQIPNAVMAIGALLAGLVAGLSPAARGFLLNLGDQIFKDSKGEPK